MSEVPQFRWNIEDQMPPQIEGWHVVRCVRMDWAGSNAGHKYVSAHFELVHSDPKLDKLLIFHPFNVRHPNPESSAESKHQMNNLVRAIGETSVADFTPFLGVLVRAKLGHDGSDLRHGFRIFDFRER
jgi:hypothetical protein